METALSVLAIGVGIVVVVGLAILILRLVDRFTLGPSMTPEAHAEYERQFLERLLHPRWTELEDHFGFAMPHSLHELYSDANQVGRNSFYVVPPDSTNEDDHHFIARFEPADMRTLKDLWFPIGDSRFPFASDSLGNYFYVELAPDSQDVPVFFIDHDGSNVSKVADSLSAFLKWKTYVEAEHP